MNLCGLSTERNYYSTVSSCMLSLENFQWQHTREKKKVIYDNIQESRNKGEIRFFSTDSLISQRVIPKYVFFLIYFPLGPQDFLLTNGCGQLSVGHLANFFCFGACSSRIPFYFRPPVGTGIHISNFSFTVPSTT